MSSVKLQHNTPLSDTGNLSYLNNGTLSLEIQSILDDIEQKVHATITEDANLEDIDTEQHDNSLNDGENNEELDYYQEKIENYLESKRAYDRSAPIFQKLKISPFYSLNQEEQAMLANAINYILQGHQYLLIEEGDDKKLVKQNTSKVGPDNSIENFLDQFHFSYLEFSIIILLYSTLPNNTIDYIEYIFSQEPSLLDQFHPIVNIRMEDTNSGDNTKKGGNKTQTQDTTRLYNIMCLSILENLQWMLEQVDDTMENQDSVMINGLRTIDRKFLSVYRNPINREAINRKIHSVLQEYNEKIGKQNFLTEKYINMIFPSAENKELVSKYIDKWRMPPANVKYDHINFWKCARDKWVYSPDGMSCNAQLFDTEVGFDRMIQHVFSRDILTLSRPFYHPFVFIKIEEALGIKFVDFPFSIQPPFLGFLAHATQEDMKRLKGYLDHAQTTKEKYTRLRVFLATTKGREFGEMILNIDAKFIEKFGDEGGKIGNELFVKYAEIMTIAEDDAINISGEFYGSTSDARFDRDKYLNSILDYANRLLEKTYEVLQSKGDIHSWSNEVQNIRGQLAQYGKIIASTDLTGNFHLKDMLKMLRIKNESYQGGSISDEKIDILKSFYHLNYKKHPQKEEIFEAIDKILQHDSQDSASTFLFFSHKGIPVLTTKFKKLSNGDMYMGSFNSPGEMHGSKLGSILLPYLLEEYSDYNIQGEVITTSPELLAYYERFGFEVRRNKNGKHIIRQYGNLSFYQIVRPAREK